MTKLQSFISAIIRISASLILLQVAYFQLSGDSLSIYIFSELGLEPTGRVIVSVIELIAAVLLLFPVVAWAGALLALLLMGATIYSHLIFLGTEIQGDGGKLFALAILVSFCSLMTLYLHHRQIFSFWRKKDVVKPI